MEFTFLVLGIQRNLMMSKDFQAFWLWLLYQQFNFKWIVFTNLTGSFRPDKSFSFFNTYMHNDQKLPNML